MTLGMIDRCYRCERPLGEHPQGILLMYPAHDGYAPLYTLPRMYCYECIQSFYKWSNVKRYTGRQMNAKEVVE